MPPVAVLTSATVSPLARGHLGEKGSFEPRKLANMLVLTSNPLSDVS